MWEGTDFSLFSRNHVYWIGSKLNSTFDDSSPYWVGNFLDDEVDGRFTPAAGRAHLQQVLDSFGDNGKFKWANYTQEVVGDLGAADAEAYVNDFTDVVSLDMYWYTIPFCDWQPFRGNVYLDPVTQSNCRTASSYGKMVNSLRIRDAADGNLQPLWMWIEDMNGGPGEGPFVANITPGQLQGAVMNSVINEARGIMYFNQSHTGTCPGGSILRQSQVTPNFCGAAQVAAVRTVDAVIQPLARVINTQSYVWSFGPGLDTMLKTYNGDAYVFAMVDGNSRPGGRTFQLPPGVSGRSVEVVNEGRTLSANAQGQFTDSFAAEYSYHIYRIKL
jgi:hypothetical protein